MSKTILNKITAKEKSKEELSKEILNLKKELKKKGKYGLSWEDKIEDVAELCKKNLPVLREITGNEINTDDSQSFNYLIEGDNYHALSTLSYTHENKVDVIYIDPPYNTGAKDWKYNNDYVDENDAYRHSKWLSMMIKRLKLGRKLLKKNGVICCTIDDYELFSLLGMFESLNSKILGIVSIVNKAEGRNQKKYFTGGIEYAVFATWGSPEMRGLELDADSNCQECGKKIHKLENKEEFTWVGFHRRNPITNPESSNRWYPIYVSKENQISAIEIEGWEKVYPINSKGEKKIWGWKLDKLTSFLNNNKNEFRAERYTKEEIERVKILYKRYSKVRIKPKSYWIGSRYNAYSYGTKLLKEILETKDTLFDFPKSLYAVVDCIDLFLPENGIVLDFFAGSGTTGHATLFLNDKDGGDRKFILCTNNENNICEEVCYPRIKNVIKGYNKSGNKVAGLGGNLKYFKTDFIDAKQTDANKKKLTFEATSMLCLKEGTFYEVKTKNVNENQFRIFKNNKIYTGIIYDDLFIEDFKIAIKDINAKFRVYVFSLGDDNFEEEFEDIKNKVKVNPIPEAILRVYRKIFK